MSGRPTKAYQIINEYIEQLALRAPAPLDVAEKSVRGLESALKTVNGRIAIVEKKTSDRVELVMGAFAQSPLTVDECGNLSVAFRPGVMHYDEREEPAYMDSAHIIQLGTDLLDFRQVATVSKPSEISHCCARNPAMVCDFYLANKVLETVLRAEFGYNGSLPSKVTKEFVSKLIEAKSRR